MRSSIARPHCSESGDHRQGKTLGHPQHVESVDVREPEVEEHEIGGAGLDVPQGIGAGARREHRMLCALEVAPQEFADLAFVFHDEDRCHGPILVQAGGRRTRPARISTRSPHAPHTGFMRVGECS